MSQVKIPSFLSKKFSALSTQEEKKQFLANYKSWCDSTITKDLVKHIHDSWEDSVIQEDKKDFLSIFQFNYGKYFNKGFRKALKQIQKQLNYEV